MPHADAQLRLEMVRVATEAQHGFVVDDRELQRDGPSYSVDTLSALRAEYPLRPMGLIIGMDAFLSLPKWYHWREILQLAHIVVAHRPGWRAPDMGPLGDLLADHIGHYLSGREDKPQCILPVPLHKKRLRQRGFNQSIELARPVAKKTGLTLLLNHVVRVRETEAQTGLDAKQRRKNIRGAFECVKAMPYEYVAILDDVVTTGSTVNELARVLKKAGVKRVDVWSIARAG